MVHAEFYPDTRHYDHGPFDGGMAQGQRIEGTKTERHGSRRIKPDLVGLDFPMARNLPHCQKSLDFVLHAVQRRMGAADALSILCIAGLERLAEVGISTCCGWNELDRYICHGMDHAGLLQ